MSGRGEEVFVGVVCAVLALMLLLRIDRALRTGTVPLYRTSLRRAEAGNVKFFALVAINALLFVTMFVIAADLLLGLKLRA